MAYAKIPSMRGKDVILHKTKQATVMKAITGQNQRIYSYANESEDTWFLDAFNQVCQTHKTQLII